MLSEDGLTGGGDQWPDQALVVERTLDAPRARTSCLRAFHSNARSCRVEVRHVTTTAGQRQRLLVAGDADGVVASEVLHEGQRHWA